MSVVLVPSLSDDQVLAWSAEDDHLPLLPDSPFHQLVGLSRPEMKASHGLDATGRRQLSPHFVDTFQWRAIRPLGYKSPPLWCVQKSSFSISPYNAC